MGFLSDITKVASSTVQKARDTVTEAKQAVTETVSEVKQKVAPALTRAQEEVSGVRSSFDQLKKSAAQAVANGGAVAAIDVGALKKANPGSLAGVDEEGIAKELSGKVMKDPAGVTAAIGGLDKSDRDDVSEELAKSLSTAQLEELAGTPDGRGVLNKMRFELDEGPTWPGEQEQVDRIDAALNKVPASKPAEVAKPVDAPKVDPAKAAATGAEYDPKSPKVSDDTKLPADPKEILTHLTQLNGQGGGDERCGSTALVAGAIAKDGGVQGAANLARQLAKDARANKDPISAKTYEDIAKKLSDPKTATYGQLGRLSETIFNANASGDAMSGKDLTKLQKIAGNEPPSVHLPPGHIPETFNTIEKLAPGESWPAKIAVNGSKDGNHWIQIGKDKNGKAFVYDPMPKKGEPQVIYQEQDPAKFAAYQSAMFPSGNATKGYANTD